MRHPVIDRAARLLSIVATALLLAAGCGRSTLVAAPGDAGVSDGRVRPPDAGCRSSSECDDGRACNGIEQCVGGRCAAGAAPVCDDGVTCTIDRCTEASGGCESVPDSRSCGPGEVCDPSVGCVVRRCTSDAECDDGFVCNGPEICAGATCAGSMPPFCDDGIACTVDECSEREGGCVGRPDSSLCDDGLFCTGVESCAPRLGGCVSSPPVDCDDGVFCTSDRCDERTRTCLHPRREDVPECRCSPEICDDAFDNDCDMVVDCRDPDCIRSPVCTTDGGIRDGGIDAGPLDGGRDGGPLDAGVDSGPIPDGAVCTMRELGIAACTDGFDNDCDRVRDCGDTDCSPFGPMQECCNGLDDDGDGLADVFTCRCFSDADCAGVGDLEQVCWTSLYSVCAPRCNFYGGDTFCRGFDPALRCNAMTGQCYLP